MSQESMSIDELKRMAGTIRCDIIEMTCTAAAGHPGGSLSATDIVTALYFRVMRIDPANPQWPDRDRFILSKGHACPAWYSALAERGYFDKKHLSTLRRLGSMLQGHPDMHKCPGIDMSVGSLGQGISAGLGMALAGKLRKKDYPCVGGGRRRRVPGRIRLGGGHGSPQVEARQLHRDRGPQPPAERFLRGGCDAGRAAGR